VVEAGSLGALARGSSQKNNLKIRVVAYIQGYFSIRVQIMNFMQYLLTSTKILPIEEEMVRK
jgi:hypothetical protein